MIKKYFLKILIIFAGIGVGFLAGYIFNQSPQEKYSELHKNPANEYKFINPLLQCDDIENISNKKILDMKKQVENFIGEETGKNNITFAAVYFRDLNNGPWFGINEKEYFSPGSLLKLPLMISIFKAAESNPGFYRRKFFIRGEMFQSSILNRKRKLNRIKYILWKILLR